MEQRAKEAAEAATLAANVASMSKRLDEALSEIRGRDERYFELAAKLNNLCESGHRRITALEKTAEQHRSEIDGRVAHRFLENKFELMFGVDCTKEDQRDRSRAAYKQMMKIDFVKLNEVLEIDPDKIKEAVNMTDNLNQIRADGRRRLWNWVWGGIGSIATAGLLWLASGWHFPAGQ